MTVASSDTSTPAGPQRTFGSPLLSPYLRQGGPQNNVLSPSPLLRNPLLSPYGDSILPGKHRVLVRKPRPSSYITSPDDSDEDEDEDVTGDSSFLAGFANNVNLFLGVGVVSLPYGVRVAGWIPAFTVLLFLTLITSYSGVLLGRIVRRNSTKYATFLKMGQSAYGTKGAFVVAIGLYGELFCVTVMFFIIMADNLVSLFPTFASTTEETRTRFLLIVYACVMPTLWIPSLKILSYGSIIGVIASFLLLGVVFAEGLTNKNPMNNPGGNSTWGSLYEPAPTQLYTRPDQIPLCFGLFMIAFAGHSCLPTICMSLKNRQNFNSVVAATYGIIVPFNVAMAAAGYLMFGTFTKEMVTVNINDTGLLKALTCLTTWMIVINPSTKFALVIQPQSDVLFEIIQSLHQRWRHRHRERSFMDSSFPDGSGRASHFESSPLLTPGSIGRMTGAFLNSTEVDASAEPAPNCCGTAKATLVVGTIKTVILSAAVLCAILVKNFATIASFVGSLFSFFLSAAFPCIMYLHVFRGEVGRLEKSINYIIIVVSTLMGIVGAIAPLIVVPS